MIKTRVDIGFFIPFLKWHFTNKLFTIGKLFLLLIFCLEFSRAQNIPASRRVEWNIAGIPGGIPCQTTVVDITQAPYNADKTGVSNVSTIVTNALNSTPANTVIYFPNGTYRFTATVNVPSNKVLRGQSVSGTLLNFNLGAGNNCFNIQGTSTATSSTVTASVTKGGNTLTLSNASAFVVGDDILMTQANNVSIVSGGNVQAWANDLRGQLFVITGKAGNTLTLDRTFTLDYNIADAITVTKVNLVKNVGFERLTIDRVDANSGTNNETMLFDLTANCWMSCVRSLRTGRYHVYLNDSRNAEIRGCYFYDAKAFAGGGDGYGVLCQDHVGECLIENNIFRRLRHAMIVKEGASRNVYGYNYSREATWTSSGIPADISLHGHYPYHNLFEGNINQRVTNTDFWGKAGPGNTLFRNRTQGTYDVEVQYDSDNQNFEANEITNPSAAFCDNCDASGVTGTIRIANNINGVIDNAPGSAVLNSYYRSSAPAFFGALPWPAIGHGTPFNTNSIPALNRYNTFVGSSNVQDLMDHCNCSVLPVELLNFDLEALPSAVRITWATAEEKNNAWFAVERSEDGIHFTEIHRLPGTNRAMSYEYLDSAFFSSMRYYRLVQYDGDGEIWYGPVKQVDARQDKIRVSPNPFREYLELELPGMEAKYELTLLDLHGKEHWRTAVLSGIQRMEFPDHMAPGFYYLRINAPQYKEIIKLLKAND